MGLTAFNAAAIGKLLKRKRFSGPTSCPVTTKPQDRKSHIFSMGGPCSFSNRCLNFNRAFETSKDGFEHCKDKALAVGGTARSRPNRIRDAKPMGLCRRASGQPRHPRDDAAIARRACPRCRDDSGAACRGTRAIQGAKNGSQHRTQPAAG
jgi:hypothetical protein